MHKSQFKMHHKLNFKHRTKKFLNENIEDYLDKLEADNTILEH